MRLHKTLLADHGATVYVMLIIVCTLVLMFSMPWASRLSELISQPWQPFPVPFFLTYAFLSAAIALNRGASVVPSDQLLQTRALGLVLVRIGFGQLLILPLISYSRVLFPDGAGAIFLSVGYVLLFSMSLGFLGILFELHAARRARSSTAVRYGFLMLYAGVPLLFLVAKQPAIRAVATTSPMAAVWRLLSQEGTAAEQWIIYLVPAVVSVLSLVLVLKQCRRTTDG